MRTLVVSDTHLGTLAGVDLLRRPAFVQTLVDRLHDVDRLVILGDFLELREVPIGDAADHAVLFLEAAGQAVADIVIAGGNHDHQLIGGWAEQLPDLGFDHRIEPTEAGPVAQRLADAARPARVSFAYPGLWLRDDVYAHHGHYLDLHTLVPTIERLAAGAMSRLMAPIPETGARPRHYETALVPLYAWVFALAQRSNDSVQRAGARSSSTAWEALAGPGRRQRPVRALVLSTLLRAATAGVNLAGLGPLRAELSGASLRRGSLHGMGEALRRLGVDAPYVVFGHTHRSGPWPVDDPAEWVTPTGTRLVNTGSWVHQPHFLGPVAGDGPYWPGTAVLVEATGPPRLERLLADRTHEDLRAGRA